MNTYLVGPQRESKCLYLWATQSYIGQSLTMCTALCTIIQMCFKCVFQLLGTYMISRYISNFEFMRWVILLTTKLFTSFIRANSMSLLGSKWQIFKYDRIVKIVHSVLYCKGFRLLGQPSNAAMHLNPLGSIQFQYPNLGRRFKRRYIGAKKGTIMCTTLYFKVGIQVTTTMYYYHCVCVFFMAQQFQAQFTCLSI